jgi:predicted nucleic acid-binding protein
MRDQADSSTSYNVLHEDVDHLRLDISDSDDEWIVAEAMAGDADMLVTGDRVLQELGKRAPLPIVPPRELWNVLRGAGAER